MITDPIADMLTRIRNAQMAGKQAAEIPYSRLKNAIALLMEQRGFIKKVEVRGRKARKVLHITLRYREGEGAIMGIRRISKPGQRMYVGSSDIQRVRGGRGMAVISTSRGMLTDREARVQGVGGEYICEIW